VAAGVALLVAGVGGFAAWRWTEARRAEEAAAAEAEAERTFGPALARLEAKPTPPAEVDLDKTMRVLRELDLQLREQPDMEAYLAYVAQQDYTGVDPRVMKARRDLLQALLPLHAKRREAEDQRAMWEATTETVLTLVTLVDAPAGPAGPVSIDRERALVELERLREERDLSRSLQRDVAELQGEVLDQILSHSEEWSAIRNEWSTLTQHRESAWLGVAKGDWQTAAAEAERAVNLPRTARERDAHLILALAAIEGGPEVSDQDPARLLDAYLATHPGETAPARLLQGVLLAREGRTREAEHAFDLSSKEYVTQSAVLSDRYDPRWERAQYLRRTSSGNNILGVYRSSMLGAGYWSPDLQLARLAFERGDAELGRKRIRDHFQRRREQADGFQLLVEDLVWCETAFGTEFRTIFPEESWLDLDLGRTLTRGALKLGVQNRSDRGFPNATLLLALHLTDMAAGDYEVVKVGETAPMVAADGSTSFGTLEVAVPWGDSTKGVDTVIFEKTRSILITEEGVMWVDTEDFKRRAAEELLRAPAPADPANQALQLGLQALRGDVGLTVERVPVLADNVVVTLPARLAPLAPLFQLSVDGAEGVPPAVNELKGETIRLVFKGVYDFDAGGFAPPLTLRVLGPGLRLRLDFAGDAGGTYRVSGAPRVE